MRQKVREESKENKLRAYALKRVQVSWREAWPKRRRERIVQCNWVVRMDVTQEREHDPSLS